MQSQLQHCANYGLTNEMQKVNSNIVGEQAKKSEMIVDVYSCLIVGLQIQYWYYKECDFCDSKQMKIMMSNACKIRVHSDVIVKQVVSQSNKMKINNVQVNTVLDQADNVEEISIQENQLDKTNVSKNTKERLLAYQAMKKVKSKAKCMRRMSFDDGG